MNQKRTYFASGILVLAGILAIVIASGSVRIAPAFGGLFTPADTTVKGPKITINEVDHDFGKIEQQTLAVDTFIIGNVGTDTLVIMSANPSCGCTAAVLDEKKVAPGKTTRLNITFDPRNKAEGQFTKTITVVSNSVVEPQKQLRIHGTIFKSKTAHKDMMHLDGVFDGNCASCHVEKGKGELGAKLYEADCAICHGSKADNKPGPDIASDEMMGRTPESWKKIITEGIANSNMPAFHTKHKGPLGDEEIASLVDYLSAYKKNLAREHQMKSGGAAVPTSSNK